MGDSKQYYDNAEYWEDFYKKRLTGHKDYKSKRSILNTLLTWIGLGWRASLPVGKIAAKKLTLEGSKSLLKTSYAAGRKLLTWKNAKTVTKSITHHAAGTIVANEVIKAIKKYKSQPTDDTKAIIIEHDENGNEVVRFVNLKTGEVIDTENMNNLLMDEITDDVEQNSSTKSPAGSNTL